MNTIHLKQEKNCMSKLPPDPLINLLYYAWQKIAENRGKLVFFFSELGKWQRTCLPIIHACNGVPQGRTGDGSELWTWGS